MLNICIVLLFGVTYMGQSALNYIHCRSEFSLLKGVLSFERICSLAAAAGERYAGVTDINNLYGLPGFLETAERFGLKPLSGSVITSSAKGNGREYRFNRLLP